MSNFIEVGGVQFEIRADGSLALAEIDKVEAKAENSEKAFGKMSHGIKVAFTAIAGVISAAFAGFVAWMKKAIPMASSFNESQSKMLTVFSSIQKEALSTARALTTYGFSLSEATQILGDTGDVLTGLGMGQQDALKLSDTIARLAQDLTSFTNYSGGVSGASQVLTKALLGERDALVGLGIKLNETELKRKGYSDSMSMQQKAEITLQAIMEQSRNAIGDYGRTQDQFANQQRKLAANFKDLSVKVAQQFLPSMNRMLVWANKQFEKSQDLEETTSRLTELLKQRKEVTDKLSGSIGKLTEQEQRNLEVQELQIKAELNDTISRLTKNYNKYFQEGQSTASYQTLQKGTLAFEGSTRIEALQKLSFYLKQAYQENLNYINSTELSQRQTKLYAAYQQDLANKMKDVNGEIENAKNQQKYAVEELAKAFKQNLISEEELGLLDKKLKGQIMALAKDPNFLKSVEDTGKVIGQKLGDSVKNSFSLSFQDRFQLRLDLGMDREQVKRDISDRLKALEPEFERIKKFVEERGTVGWGEGGEKNKKFMDEYMALQQMLNELIKEEGDLRQQNLDDYSSAISGIIQNVSELAGSWMEGVNDSTRRAIETVKAWAGKLEQVLKIIQDIQKAQEMAEKSEKAMELSTSNYIAIVATVLELLVGIVSTIIEANQQMSEQEKVVERLNQQIEEYLSSIEAIDKLLDFINEKYKSGDNPLDIALSQEALEADEKLIQDQLQKYQDMLDEASLEFGIDLNWDNLTPAQIAAQADELTGLLTGYERLLTLAEDSDIEFNMFGAAKVIGGSQDKWFDFLSEARAIIGEDVFLSLSAENKGQESLYNALMNYIQGHYDILGNAIDANSNYFSKMEELLDIQNQLSMLEGLDTIGATPEGLQMLVDQVELLKQEYSLLTEMGEDTSGNVDAQLEAIQKEIDIYQALNENGEYQSEINALLLEQAKLRKEAEEDTADALQEQLDIMNKLKGTGLFDEQNLYQVGLLGSVADQQGYSIQQKLDLFQNYNVDALAAQRNMSIGSMTVNLNEASGDSLDRGVSQLMVNLWGGF